MQQCLADGHHGCGLTQRLRLIRLGPFGGMSRRTPVPDSRTWWNRAAEEDAPWYIATTPDPFFERGRRDVEELVAFCGLRPSRDKVLLEIGAGAGRMTRRFAELVRAGGGLGLLRPDAATGPREPG